MSLVPYPTTLDLAIASPIRFTTGIFGHVVTICATRVCFVADLVEELDLHPSSKPLAVRHGARHCMICRCWCGRFCP